ncbi:MAG: hypothetical protein H8F28_18355 [Fibrella sp.]|nr:hypothetical protein [Armatimonadota bacterium]
MPALDKFHHIVKNALVKDGWTVTDDPLSLRYEDKNLFVDFGAERLISADEGDAENRLGLLNGEKPLSVSLSLDQLESVGNSLKSANKESRIGFVPPDLSPNVEPVRLNGR